LRESLFFQNCGTFNTNQNKKCNNFEKDEIRATVFLKYTDFSKANGYIFILIKAPKLKIIKRKMLTLDGFLHNGL
jgi:hypothetical protein